MSTISFYILLALIVLLTVFLGIFHVWSIFLTTKETITDIRKHWLGLSPLERKKSFLRYLLTLAVLIIFLVFLWMYGHHII